MRFRAIEQRRSEFHQALRRHDQPRFDRLFEYAREHADASGLLNHQNPLLPALLSVDSNRRPTSTTTRNASKLKRALEQREASHGRAPPGWSHGMTELDTVAFDIETISFDVDEQLTVVGFDTDIGSRIFLNTDGRAPPSSLEARVNEELASSVSLSVPQTERALLCKMSTFVESTLAHRDAKLVLYNGERWNGGFDLPFLRIRLCYHEIDWPFTGLLYIDAMDVFETRFDTSGETLTGVYGELIGSGLTRLDPFVDSKRLTRGKKGTLSRSYATTSRISGGHGL